MVVGGSYGPELAGGWNRGHPVKDATCPRVWARGDAPVRAVPVLDQRLVGAAPIGGVSHRPDVACRDGCHPGKFVVTRSTVRAGDDAPLSAIPVLDQRLVATPVVEESHGPDVACREGRHPSQVVEIQPGV